MAFRRGTGSVADSALAPPAYEVVDAVRPEAREAPAQSTAVVQLECLDPLGGLQHAFLIPLLSWKPSPLPPLKIPSFLALAHFRRSVQLVQ